MALSAGLGHLVVKVSDLAHVDAARRAVVREAQALGASEALQARLTVVVQELARNLVNHAGQGRLLVGFDGARLDILSVDRGPGMANVALCLTDSYSTTGTMGAGLGAIRRMSDVFDIHSQPGKGTLVFAGFSLGPAAEEAGLVHAGIGTAYPGETLCGDAWAVLGQRLMVCDGLGHGHSAHGASSRARELFMAHDPSRPLPMLMESLHRALQGTRGGAVAVAEIQPQCGQVEFCGVGNIAGTLLADRPRSMVSGNGTVGYKVGRIQSFSYPWNAGTTLVMTSDGIVSKWNLDGYPGIRHRHPALVAALMERDFRRLNDDATVVVVKSV
jgi:anti-sigma regulatory factor (Ser/Thr protein kinase)